MFARYSLVLQPSPEVVLAVKAMKEHLSSKIGWYHSKNALAHLTINEFEAPVTEKDKIAHHLNTITTYLPSETVCFDHFDTFPNGAFFLAPDTRSKLFLKNILQQVHEEFRYPTVLKNNEPHISIGRRLQEEQLRIAHELFASPSLSFLCDRIALRIFNPSRKQFDIISEFVFQGKTKEGTPLTLF